jgi:hypothetical protein
MSAAREPDWEHTQGACGSPGIYVHNAIEST